MLVTSRVLKVVNRCEVVLENGECLLPNDAVKVMKCDRQGNCLNNSDGAFLNFHQYSFIRGEVDDAEVS